MSVAGPGSLALTAIQGRQVKTFFPIGDMLCYAFMSARPLD